jgi:signal transduction histidine kinase
MAWFPLGGHLIEGLFHTARSIESTARQRDSLISLGTLAAGLAHELNNPAAAATRASHALDKACTALLGSLRELASGHTTAQQFLALDELRAEVAGGVGGADLVGRRRDPLELADAEDELADWLGDQDVDHPERIAEPLASAGADVAWCERVVAALDPSPPGPALAWVAGTLEVRTLLAEVHESTGRISELVAAVRSYSQMDRASRQEVDVTDGLESTLLVLGHKLRGGVDVVRDYAPDLPKIDAYAGELNQVWTNLVDNAIDAMDGQGTLTLTTRSKEGGVVIDVTDTGSGMPPDVVARAFEAFFTTKDVGRGTGLGLDIARRIVVERHGGTIDIDTSPTGTTISVWLPQRPPQG